MTGHCSVANCPFAHDGELLTDKKCVSCSLWKMTGLDIERQIKMAVLKMKSEGIYAEKVYMRKIDFQKVMGDCTNSITAFDNGGERGYLIAGCVIEIRDDLKEDVLLIVE